MSAYIHNLSSSSSQVNKYTTCLSEKCKVSGYLAHKFKYKSVDLPNISTSTLQVSEYTPCPQIKHKSVDVELIHKYNTSQWIYNFFTSTCKTQVNEYMFTTYTLVTSKPMNYTSTRNIQDKDIQQYLKVFKITGVHLQYVQSITLIVRKLYTISVCRLQLTAAYYGEKFPHETLTHTKF